MRETPPKPAPPTPPSIKQHAIRWILPVTLLTAIWVWQSYEAGKSEGPEIGYSALYQLASEGKVDHVVITGQTVLGDLKAEELVEGKKLKRFRTMIPSQPDPTLLPALRDRGVKIAVRSEDQPLLVRALIAALPWVLLLGGWMWLSRRAERAIGGGLFGGVTKGNARRFSEETDVRVRFDDVAGLASAKRDLLEVVEYLRSPAKFQRLGARVPRGVLLVGPPGTGKTLLARAVAGEAGVPFFSVNGSEFIELFVGVGASRVRELFENAKKNAPCIVFIDEIDAVGRARGTGLGGGHDEREQTLNQLLSEMDGFTRNDLTIVLAATNRPDVLDAALLRPGRFDRRVILERPERVARRAILGVHARNKTLAEDVDLDAIAASTAGFSGADLENLLNEAAILATRRDAQAIAMCDVRAAEDKVEVGDPRETPLSPEERRRVAVHESGHAIVAASSPNAEPVERVTILPRGLALGATRQAAGEDRHVATRSELVTRLRVLLGGLEAERVILGETSSGAENDLKIATRIATDMVAHYGMSDRLGPVYYEHHVEHPFLGQRIAEGALADTTAGELDAEVRRVLAEASVEARAMVERQRPAIDRLIQALLEHETLDRDDIERLLEGPKAPHDGYALAAS